MQADNPLAIPCQQAVSSDVARRHFPGDVVSLPDRQGDDGQRRVFRSPGGELAAVRHEQVRHVMRPPVAVDHAILGAFRDNILDIFTELKDLRGQSLALDGMGRALEQVGRTEEALGVLRRRLEIEELLGDRGRVAEALNNLGGLLQRIGRLDEGGETFERSYVICRELGDVPRMAAALKGRGSVFEAMGNVEVAVAAYEEALRLSPDDEEVRRRLEGVSRSERHPPEPSEAA